MDAPQAGTRRHYTSIMLICFAVLTAVFLSSFVMTDAGVAKLVGESGPVEIMSAAGYVTLIVALSREGGWAFLKNRLYFVIILVAACLREMDFHTRFTHGSINKKAFFLSPEDSLGAKVLAASVFLLLAWAGLMLVWRHGRSFVSALVAGRVYALAISVSIALAGMSKVLDGAARKLAGIGIVLSPFAERSLTVLEEVLEMGIPIFLVVALFAFFPWRTGATSGEETHL